jgi:hypothetical protein
VVIQASVVLLGTLGSQVQAYLATQVNQDIRATVAYPVTLVFADFLAIVVTQEVGFRGTADIPENPATVVLVVTLALVVLRVTVATLVQVLVVIPDIVEVEYLGIQDLVVSQAIQDIVGSVATQVTVVCLGTVGIVVPVCRVTAGSLVNLGSVVTPGLAASLVTAELTSS